MIRALRVLRARRERSARDQHGYALVAVLAVIALTSVTIAALLGMLVTTINVTTSQERSARELRSADSAIEAAIAQLRRNPGAAGAGACAVGEPVTALDQITFDQGNSSPVDDVTVQVGCEPAGLGDPSATADQVRLVGEDGYQGDVPWGTDCSGGAPGPGCLPWSAATGGGAPGGLTPSLVHSGPQELRFDSGITARRGAAVLRNPTDGSPAVEASGQYLQGDPGPGGGGSDPCGILTPGGASPAGAIVDLDDAPVCDSADAGAVDASPTDPLVGFQVSGGNPAVPACSGAVVTIPAGRYDAARTAALSSLLGTCSARTFHFAPGVISVDAPDGLVLDSPGSYYVFGAPQGWSTGSGVAASAVANDPTAPLCDPSVSGTSLIISGRTEIRHRSGRVALCPAFSPDPDDPYPAIYQETSVPNMTITPVDPLPWGRTFSCFLGQPCTGLVASRTHFANVTTTGSRPLSSVKVLVTGTEGDTTQNNLVSNRTTTIEVRRTSNNSLLCSTGTMTGMPNAGLTSAFELRTGACATAIDNEADLNGTLLWIRHSMQLASSLVSQRFEVTAVDVQVDPAIARSEPGEVSAPAGSWNDVGNAATADASLATPVMPCGYLVCEVVRPTNLVADNTFTHSMTLSDMDLALPPELAASGVDANITDLRLLVGVEPTSVGLPPGLDVLNVANFRPEMTVRAELATPSGQRCLTTPGYVNSRQEVAFDLLGADGATPGCDALLQDYSQLEGAAVALHLDMPCVRNPTPGLGWQCLSTGTAPSYTILRVRPPSIRSVSLAVSTDAYTGPPPTSQVHIDARTGATGSSFNALGTVWMPLSDLDLHWRGDVTEGRPIVAGDLVLNGLGSDMAPSASAGTVCCSSARPGSRTVELTASVDGRPVLAVTVLFTDIDPDSGDPSPGYAVDVLEWATCDRNGVCSAGPGGS